MLVIVFWWVVSGVMHLMRAIGDPEGRGFNVFQGLVGIVGGIIVLTNTRTILRALEVSDNWRATIYAFVVGIWIAAVALAVSKVVRGAPVEVVGEPTTDQPTVEQEARS